MAADPTTSGTTVAAAILTTASATISFLGLHPSDVAYAAMGALAGLAITPPTQRTRALILALLAIPIGSIFAHVMADILPPRAAYRSVAAVFSGLLCPLILEGLREQVSQRIGELFSGLIDRLLSVLKGPTK